MRAHPDGDGMTFLRKIIDKLLRRGKRARRKEDASIYPMF